jgi:hypothetical protein
MMKNFAMAQALLSALYAGVSLLQLRATALISSQAGIVESGSTFGNWSDR